MTRITYIEFNGAEHPVDVSAGTTVMQGAVHNAINGIVGECGGALACATCHCYVDEGWMDRVGPPSEMEMEMLESAASETKANSRLGCQITMNDALDGLVVRLPEAQY